MANDHQQKVNSPFAIQLLKNFWKGVAFGSEKSLKNPRTGEWAALAGFYQVLIEIVDGHTRIENHSLSIDATGAFAQ